MLNKRSRIEKSRKENVLPLKIFRTNKIVEVRFCIIQSKYWFLNRNQPITKVENDREHFLFSLIEKTKLTGTKKQLFSTNKN